MPIDTLIIVLISTFGSAALVYFLITKTQANPKRTATAETPIVTAPPQVEQLVKEAENKAKQIVLDAKDEALKIKERADEEAQTIRNKAAEDQKRLENKLDELNNKIKESENKENQLKSLQGQWQKKNEEIEKLRLEQVDKLESISSLTKDEAKKLILDNLEATLNNEVARKIKESEEKIQLEVDTKAKELLVEAMQHGSTDYVPEYTISTVKLPDEEVKGRIIGKEGRNIRTFEDLTGVNIDFEEGGELRISSFDAIRREVARLSMETLIKDGRIHPARIEEVIQKTQENLDKIITQAGEELCAKVGVFNLPKELVKKLGIFKYRTSYGQNMIQHTLEETQIGVKIANEIGADVAITKLACLLHDIGKVITDKEGNHIELGVEYLRKFNIPKPVLAAVADHHNDKPSSIEGVIVQIADSISGSRPGARYEDYESFLKRMNTLEDAAKSFPGVDKAFAISAGREVRVIVKPEDINDVEAVKLSHDIAQKIENEQTFPGTVKVVVIRELRSVATAT